MIEDEGRMRLYTLHAPYMKSGDLIECASDGWLGRAIRWRTGKNVNHSSMLLRLDEYCGMRDRRYLIEAEARGLEVNILSEWIEDYGGMVWWSPLKATDAQRSVMVSWAFNEMCRGRGYDYRGLVAQLWRRVSISGKRMFCSELYHAGLIEAGIAPAETIARRPGEFHELGVHERPIRIL